jgi:hypothetical protein
MVTSNNKTFHPKTETEELFCKFEHLQATTKTGEDQYKVVSARDGGIWTVKTVREAKDTTWRQNIGLRVIEVRIDSNQHSPRT